LTAIIKSDRRIPKRLTPAEQANAVLPSEPRSSGENVQGLVRLAEIAPQVKAEAVKLILTANAKSIQCRLAGRV
jgi:hypothetical protein